MIFSRLSSKIVKKSFNKLMGMSSLIAKNVDLSKIAFIWWTYRPYLTNTSSLSVNITSSDIALIWLTCRPYLVDLHVVLIRWICRP